MIQLRVKKRLPSQYCFAYDSCFDPCLPFAGIFDDLAGFNDQEIEFQA